MEVKHNSAGPKVILCQTPRGMSSRFSIADCRTTVTLDEGGLGAVYRATDTKLRPDVAIKVLTDAFTCDRGPRVHRAESGAGVAEPSEHRWCPGRLGEGVVMAL